MSRETTYETDVRNWQTIARTLAGLFPNMRIEVYHGRSHFDPPHRAERLGPVVDPRHLPVRDVRVERLKVAGGSLHLDERVDVRPLQRELSSRRVGHPHAVDDVLAVDAAREGLVLHLLLHAGHVHLEDAAGRLHVRDRGDEAGQLVAGINRLAEQIVARQVQLADMRGYRINQLLREASFGGEAKPVH